MGQTSNERPRSFAKMREEEKIAEQAHLGPGAIDGHLKPFASGMNKVGFGDKYQTKYDNNPAPG